MKNTQSKLAEQMRNAYPVKSLNKSHMYATISMAKQVLVHNNKYKNATVFFIFNQIKNISLLFWIIQLVCFICMVFNLPNIHDIDDVRNVFVFVVPILILYILPELYKTYINRVIEIETVCTHSAIKIWCSKLIILSISNFVVIALISVIWGGFNQINIFVILCNGLIPFNIAVSISLLFFDFVKLKSPYIMFAGSTIISFLLANFQSIGNAVSQYWMIVLPLSLILLTAVVCLTLYRINYIKEWYYGT